MNDYGNNGIINIRKSRIGEPYENKKYTRVTAFFLAVCTVLLMLPLSVRADEYWPDGVKTQSKSAIVMEVNTGTVLYEKKSHEKHYPASITKIMTVLLAIENCDMDEVVTFSADAVFKMREILLILPGILEKN